MAKTKKPVQKLDAIDLPPDVSVKDLQRLKWDSKDTFSYKEMRELGLDSDELQFFLTEGFGWVITTLLIKSKGRYSGPSQTDRYYGISVDGKLCRIGHGPHVKRTVRVYINKKNLKYMQKYIDLHKKGLANAGDVRDRISSRRAMGQMYRQQGLSSWMW